MKRILLISLFSFLFICFFFRGCFFVDPDFGWHIRMGELILTSGIPATDPFSYTMPSYPFVDHEWLVDLFFSWSFSHLGYGFLAFLFSTLGIAAVWFSFVTIPKKSRSFVFAPLLLTGIGIATAFGVRPQVISWLFFAILLFILRILHNFDRLRWILPLLFFCWANLHGGFAIGIVALFVAVAVRWGQEKQINKQDLLVVLFSIAATLLTPYHQRLWWEIWVSMSDTSLHWSIQEWMPVIFFPTMTFWALVILSLIFIWRARRKFHLFDLLLYGGLLAAALSSVRHMPFWLLITFPMTVQALAFFEKDVEKIPFALSRLRKLLIVFFIMCVVFALFDQRGLFLRFFQKSPPSGYPDHAIVYLQKNFPKGELFSTYDWGGYLLWKLPEKKVFIDGRMPSWKQDLLAEESSYAFADYQAFLSGKLSFSHVIQQYGITTILIPAPMKENHTSFSDLLDRLANQFFHYPLQEKDRYATLRKTLKQRQWKVVYQDSTAVIYQQ